MPIPINRKRIRNIQNINTHSGRVDQAFTPYKLYMKLSCLEMEKERRGHERASAMNRVNNIDERFREIEAEKAEIIRILKERGEYTGSDIEAVKKTSSARMNSGKFTIKY